jgi:hypothetical protein
MYYRIIFVMSIMGLIKSVASSRLHGCVIKMWVKSVLKVLFLLYWEKRLHSLVSSYWSRIISITVTRTRTRTVVRSDTQH